MIIVRDGLMGKVGLELKFNTWAEGPPRCSSGWDSTLPMQGAQV